jgi:hypothetical protein
LNVAVKGGELFVGWGQIFPYDFVPFSERGVINALMFSVWIRMIWIWVSFRRKNPGALSGGLGQVLNYAILNIVYVAGVTLPFAIDARYLLGPGLLAFGATLQCLERPLEFFGAPVAEFFSAGE